VALEVDGGALAATQQKSVAARPPNMGFWRRAAFSSPAFPLSAMLIPVLIYLPDYYARELGVDLAVLASVMMLVRLFDLWFDPFLGFVMDKTGTRFGRYRPWFVAGAPISLVAVWMLFMAPVGMTGGYLLFWLVAAYVGQSMGQLGHMAWAASSAPEYDQRSRVYGWILAFSVLGTFAIMATPPFARIVLHADHVRSVQAMGWFVMAVLPVTIILALMAAKEPATPPPSSKPALRNYLDLIRRGRVARLLAADIAWGTAPALAATLFFAYMDGLKGFPRETAGLILLIYFVGGMVGAPVWTTLAKRLSKHRAMAIAGITYAVFQSMMILTPQKSIVLVTGGMFLAGLASTAGQILLRSMMADVADEERLHTGVDRTALLFSLLSGSVKIGSALAVGGGLYALKLAGFEFGRDAQNSEMALRTLEAFYAIVPAALGVLSAVIISGHKIDAKAHAEIRRQLDARDARLRQENEAAA